MENFKFWMFNHKRVIIIERFGESTLIEYVRSGIQASVKTSLVVSVTVKPKLNKNPKKEPPMQKPQMNKKNNNNPQTFLDL